MGGTPKEEIERQHGDAEAMVSGGLPCMVSVDRGEIPLAWKQHPTVASPIHSNVENKHENKANQKVEHLQDQALKNPASDNIDLESATESTEANTDPKKLVSAKDSQHMEGCCVSSRGTVDITPLVNIIHEGYNENVSAPPKEQIYQQLKSQCVKSKTNLWDEANAAQNNVHITRPSHDAWGIKKIALIFCDDFLRDVYEMPWWHGNEQMKSAIKPVLDTLGIPPTRLVRLLLACLPPGVTIPVHHDSGEWVKHTHRVHVPVIVADPSKVLFRVGLTEDAMDRVSCHPGHVFEINNQGKHAVSNCHPTEHRVHLILDYVDESFRIRRRLKLEPGEKLLQTRRSIDREAERGTRPTPSFMIIGAQKAGTTSLYDYLNQHPLVVKARRRETHCLDWRWDDSAKTTDVRRAHCHKFFYTKELEPHPSCMTGDSTPSYMIDSFRVIPRLKEVFPWQIKFIAMCRDPVKRAKSQFAMVTSQDGTPEQIKNRGIEWLNVSFEEVVQKDMENMKECGLIPYWDETTATIDQRKFDSFAGTKEEDEAWEKYMKEKIPLNTGSHSIVSRGMYELSLRSWFHAFPRNDLLVLKLEDMAKDGGVQRTVDKALAHIDLPPYSVLDESAKNTRSYDPMNDSTKVMLQRFYEPHNQRMESLLGNEWSDPWPYQ